MVGGLVGMAGGIVGQSWRYGGVEVTGGKVPRGGCIDAMEVRLQAVASSPPIRSATKARRVEREICDFEAIFLPLLKYM